jgi:hypothetical protein
LLWPEDGYPGGAKGVDMGEHGLVGRENRYGEIPGEAVRDGTETRRAQQDSFGAMIDGIGDQADHEFS